MINACSDNLYEYEGITSGAGKRAIQADIQNMRSEKLGYNAPIIVSDKKYYSYEEIDYNITNNPLTQQDLTTLNEVVAVLKQFKGFSYFEELTGTIAKFEDKIYSSQHVGKSFIDFEKNELVKGLSFIDSIHKAISDEKALTIIYQSFKAKESSKMIFSPHL